MKKFSEFRYVRSQRINGEALHLPEYTLECHYTEYHHTKCVTVTVTVHLFTLQGSYQRAVLLCRTSMIYSDPHLQSLGYVFEAHTAHRLRRIH